MLEIHKEEMEIKWRAKEAEFEARRIQQREQLQKIQSEMIQMKEMRKRLEKEEEDLLRKQVNFSFILLNTFTHVWCCDF